MSSSKNFLPLNQIKRPNSAALQFQNNESKTAKYNMMMQLPPEENNKVYKTSIKSSSNKKLPPVEKSLKKNQNPQSKNENLESANYPPMKQSLMNKSDTFLNDDFKKQISKPFEKKSYKSKLASITTLDLSSKDLKSLKESTDLDEEGEFSSRIFSKSVDYSQEIDKIFEKKNQEKLQKINDLTIYLQEIKQKNLTNMISLPQNYNNFIEVLVDEAKFSKEHIIPENFEKDMREMKIDFDIKKQKLQRIKALDKILSEKENIYRELLNQRLKNEEFSETSSNCSENSKKLFITEFKTKKPKKIIKKEDLNTDSKLKETKKSSQNTNLSKNEKDFIEINKKNLNPLRYQFICDNLPENKKERLNELMLDIETQYNKKETIKENNPFTVDEKNVELMKTIDNKLQNFQNNLQSEKKNPDYSLEKINEELYQLSLMEKNQSTLESRENIETLLGSLGIKEIENSEQNKKNRGKLAEYDENLQNLEKRAQKILENLNLEELKSEISESKNMIEESLKNLMEYKKAVEKESEKEIRDLEEEYKKKRSSYFKEVLLKIHSEYTHINELYNETAEYEKKLNLKVNAFLEEINDKNGLSFHEPLLEIETSNENNQIDFEYHPKELHEYDREITEKIKNIHPELFQNEKIKI